MLRSFGFATIVGVAVVLAACSSSGADEQQDDASATTLSAGRVTTAALEATVTTAASVTTTTAPAESGEELAGDWFACEFVETPGTPPIDGCATFDDDGLRFGPDGELSAIERVGGDEENCLFGNLGRCFAADLVDVEVTTEPIGRWTVSGTTVSLTVGECEGTLEWEPGVTYSVFRPSEMNGCEVLEIDDNAAEQAQAGGVYFGRYAGAA